MLVALAVPVVRVAAAETQQTGRVVRVGILSSSRPQLHQRPGGFFDGLRELGWIEGQNITFEVRSAEDRPARLPDLAAELVRLKVDVIMAFGPYASHSAKFELLVNMKTAKTLGVPIPSSLLLRADHVVE